MANFHSDHLKGKRLAIACPKLDHGKDIYIDKLTSMIDDAKINTLTVMIMEVPCCGGLLQIARNAAAKAARKVPVKLIVVGLQGNVISEDWV
jgi:predicted transcriptional regulator